MARLERARLAATTLLVFLVAVAPAWAGDPIMPLSQVHAGMTCTGYSVVRGTDISSFRVDVIDVVAGSANDPGARILVRVSGPAVDATGIGPGFSGSPILCPDASGVARNIGAISESVGDFGGKEVLATPIEAILATPVDGPATKPVARERALLASVRLLARSARARERALQARTRPLARSARASERALLAHARPLATPLMVSGLSPRLGALVSAAARRAGRVVLTAPPGPLGSFGPQTLRPGASVSVGLSDGDMALGGIGTVAYVDGDRVWAFGHPMDGAGRRSLLLQDAYVFDVIGNPLTLPDTPGTYKLAAPGHDLGTLSDDGLSAVVGRLGALPRTTAVRVYAVDEDTSASRVVSSAVADESGVDQPLGSSPLSLIAATALAQVASTVLDGSPARLTGTMCARIDLRERAKPLRFCDRYLTSQPDTTGAGNAVAGLAASDLVSALGLVDAYDVSELHVDAVSVRVSLQRGLHQAYLRSVRLPRHARAGRRVSARVALQVARGPKLVRRYSVRLPGDLRRGLHRLTFDGVDADSELTDLGDAITLLLGDSGSASGDASHAPQSLAELADRVAAIGRYDGVRLRRGGHTVAAFRDRELRISGRARAQVRIVGR